MDPNSVVRGFECYWKHWSVVEEWRRMHHTACGAAYNTSKIAPNHPTDSRTLEKDYGNEGDNSDAVENYNEMFVDSAFDDYTDGYSEDGYNEADNDESDDELELEFVINDEMITFFEQSMKHKMELKKQRELLEKDQDGRKRTMAADNYCKTSIVEDGNTFTKLKESSNSDLSALDGFPLPNVSANKLKRTHEMSQLYGDSSPKICGMETAVQLSFNRLCDRNKPAYWPCIPFRP